MGMFDDLLGDDRTTDIPTIPGTMDTAGLADLLGIGKRAVTTFVARNVLHRTRDNRFDTAAAVRDYIAFSKRGGNTELDAEKLRLAREQADKLELANAAVRREMLSAKSVEHEWASILRDVRAGMLAVPGRLSARLSLSQHDILEIDREIRDALENLGNGNA